MKSAQWKQSIELLKAKQASPLRSYLLSVSYSMQRNYYATFQNSVEALTASQKLSTVYREAAIALVRWGGVEYSRPELKPIFEDSSPSVDASLLAAEAKRKAERANEFAALKATVKVYIDIDMEVVAAKISDACWDPNGPRPIDCMFDERSPPTSPLPDK
jgi:hypothetical protein